MASSDEGEALQDILGNMDLFYHGVIVKLFPRNNLGIVRTASGREIAFAYNLVIVLSDSQDPNDLKQGQKVGYDLGWTSSGLRVTKIKVYPEPGAEEKPPNLEGQGSQG